MTIVALKKVARVLRLTSDIPAAQRYAVAVLANAVSFGLTWALWPQLPATFSVVGVTTVLVLLYGGLAAAFMHGFCTVVIVDYALVDPQGYSASNVVRLGVVAMQLIVAHQLRRSYDQQQLALGRLEDAVRARDEFFGLAAHELKTPLCGLRLSIELLSRALEPLRGGAVGIPFQLVDRLPKQMARMTALTSSLLDISRIQTQRLDYVFEEFLFCDMIRESVDRMALEAQRAGVTLDLIFEKQDLLGTWDRTRLEQLVANLLSNALKYGANKGVTVYVTGDERSVGLSVTDHGIGIPEDKLSSIFMRFSRAVSDRSFPGLGIGLWVSKQIVDAHGGMMSVTSRLGQGSTFRVMLPRHRLAH